VGALVPNGFYDASHDPTVIRFWFRQSSNLNIAVRTGESSGIIALDIDPVKGGDGSLLNLRDRLGDLPETLCQTTGSGGVHYIFRHPGYEVGCRTDIVKGVDFRGDGGYIVVPPSMHISGLRYKWIGDRFNEAKIADVPSPWLDFIKINSVRNQSFRDIDVTYLKVDPNANPPDDKFKSLISNNPHACKSWEYDRPADSISKDLSSSAYDMSLWNFAMHAGWMYQEALDLLLAFRRKHGLDIKKLTREDYIQRLIAKNPGINNEDKQKNP